LVMRFSRIIYCILTLSVLSPTGQAQDSVAHANDSLKRVYYANPAGKSGISAAYLLAKGYDHYENFDSALRYVNAGITAARKLELNDMLAQLLRTLGNINNAKGDYKNATNAYQEALKITDTVNDRADEAKLLNNLGIIAERKGDYLLAYNYFSKSLIVFTLTNQPKGISATYNNIGLIYHDQGNYGKAIEYGLKAVKIEETMNEPLTEEETYNNIGNIYNSENDPKLATEYYMKALGKYMQAKSKGGIATIYQNLGLICDKKNEYDSALIYYNNALKISEELGEKRKVADVYNSIGTTYFNKKDLENATTNDQKALDIFTAIGDQEGTAESMHNIAKTYYAANKYADAMKMDESALDITKRIHSPGTESTILQLLNSIYEKTNQVAKAYSSYKDFTRINDSLNSEQNTRQIVQAQLAHKFEKEQQAASLEEEKRTAVANAEAKRQKAILYFVIGILILVLAFAAFMVNRFVLIRKQKKTIEAQKGEVENKNKIIEEKNKDITDSIHYARDIQRALMPGENEFKEIFPESFVLYMPKDIVSGDFYWMAEKDGKVLLLAADCTGHGVPGALMSMIGVSLFNETVDKKDITLPGSILAEVRKGIMQTFRPKHEGQQHRDGMDAALCCIDKETLKVEFAGAYNPLWIVKAPSSPKGGITEIIPPSEGQREAIMEYTPDKQPVGVQEGQKDTFSTQTLQLEKGDTLYLFSDGYADQFGGPNGKKFKYKQFQEKILEIRHHPLAEQKKELERVFTEWKGDLEQVDDVLIIGVRV